MKKYTVWILLFCLIVVPFTVQAQTLTLTPRATDDIGSILGADLYVPKNAMARFDYLLKGRTDLGAFRYARRNTGTLGSTYYFSNNWVVGALTIGNQIKGVDDPLVLSWIRDKLANRDRVLAIYKLIVEVKDPPIGKTGDNPNVTLRLITVSPQDENEWTFLAANTTPDKPQTVDFPIFKVAYDAFVPSAKDGKGDYAVDEGEVTPGVPNNDLNNPPPSTDDPNSCGTVSDKIFVWALCTLVESLYDLLDWGLTKLGVPVTNEDPIASTQGGTT